MEQAKKMNMKEKYNTMTGDLAWDFSYKTEAEIFPLSDFEGIKIEDWSKWQDPFRLTMDAYWKYQGEKERKLYAVIDAFAQNNAHLGVTDARYINALKIFLTAVTPLEYGAHRGFAMTGRAFPGVGAQVASQMQSIDELRHAQTQLHTISQYNKYFDGLHDPFHMYDRVWYLSVPKSYFEDALSAGPFEFITAISFSFEYVLTNLLFMPFMSGAAYNGDMATVNFGFSAQSDESRHMTLGLEVIKFMLEQHPDNLPIIQRWIDKYFWRGYRLLGIVGMMMDYMLPKRVMSWKEGWEMYFEQNGKALFDDLARYGITMPKFWEHSVEEKEHLTHKLWLTFYAYGHAAAFHTWIPEDSELDWLSEKYPNTFDKYYRPRLVYLREQEKAGKRFYNPSLPQLCQTCQIPMVYTDPKNPTQRVYRETMYKGDRFHFCSDACKEIFEHEPEKMSQAWLPPHQIFQGNCGGATIPEVLKHYHFTENDGGEFLHSRDNANWNLWKGLTPDVEAA
jgi:phenol/toluene 2-monooxygenase (NADH) P3/A3